MNKKKIQDKNVEEAEETGGAHSDVWEFHSVLFKGRIPGCAFYYYP